MPTFDNACVFTALFGECEPLNEQPSSSNSPFKFICFTDNESLKSKTWEIIHVPPIFEFDPHRSQRFVKLCPHKFLQDYDASLYIDNTVLLKDGGKEFLETLRESESECVFMNHSFRATTLSEFQEVFKDRLADPARLSEQLNAYLNFSPETLVMSPLWCGVIARMHNSVDIINFGELWFYHVLRHTARDQLSVNFCLSKTNVTPQRLQIDNLDSIYHQWPVRQGFKPSSKKHNPTSQLLSLQDLKNNPALQDKMMHLANLIEEQSKTLIMVKRFVPFAQLVHKTKKVFAKIFKRKKTN